MIKRQEPGTNSRFGIQRLLSRTKTARASRLAQGAGALLLALLLVIAGVPVLAQNTGQPNDPQQIKANLKNILDSGEFQSVQPTVPSLFEKVSRWLSEWRDKIVESVKGLFKFRGIGAGASLGLQWIFIALFIALGAYIIYRLVLSYLANRKTKQAKSRTAFDVDDTENEISREPNDWLAEALRQQTTGDFRRAYRAMFLAILLKLDQAGIVTFERGRTNGEYLRTLRRADQSALYALLAPLVLEFDLRWYGDKPTTAEDAESMRGEYTRLGDLLAKEARKSEEPAPVSASLTPEQA